MVKHTRIISNTYEDPKISGDRNVNPFGFVVGPGQRINNNPITVVLRSSSEQFSLILESEDDLKCFGTRDEGHSAVVFEQIVLRTASQSLQAKRCMSSCEQSWDKSAPQLGRAGTQITTTNGSYAAPDRPSMTTHTLRHSDRVRKVAFIRSWRTNTVGV
ncbi:hypothetical protein T265_06629 [Opisthorchis viverrini]|uniref:Uncharacterized protein n=1 Tax=Opisthorchis viverrini TaxID=6198 RepID=A0A074ZJU8_OPIVI|nr:hypothetical protein T265_06629 [Opisthorchis viverrini]KER26052.1 hypothetical protein T265_06629 [Opisthorchis viverrini]